MRRYAAVIQQLKRPLVLILLLSAVCLRAQVGGTRSYRFLDLPMTARAAAIGNAGIGIWGDDINLAHSSPSLLNPSMARQAAFNYCNFVGDMNFAHLAYAHNFNKLGTGGIQLQSFGYGKFKGYDELGAETNDFRAADYCLSLQFSRPLADSLFNIGIALKTVLSQYDIYTSVGNAIDFGITYHKNDFGLTLLAKNVGVMWKPYSSTAGTEALPNTVQLGFSKKVARAPFRLFATYDQLLRWDLRYTSPIDTAGRTSSFGTTTVDSSDVQRFMNRTGRRVDNLMRHLTIGTEILVTKNFHLRIAYSYRRQREMILPEKRGANAFSFGLGFRVKRFGFSYAFTKMAVPGNSSVLGLTFSW